ncbi:MAG: twin-arginine translocation signal domain-containing protein, partial [Anaerolineales bacterium]|nr:twin-arginine translocation signal domain-containing protein [Anaerolineales bacterium]
MSTFSRRRFLQTAALLGAGALVSACGKEIVKETVITEKVVTATIAPPTPKPVGVPLTMRVDPNPDLVAAVTTVAERYLEVDP